MYDDTLQQSLLRVQELCFIYYPLADFKAKIGYKLACLKEVNVDLFETEFLAKEMVDRVIWSTIELDFSDVPDTAAKLSATVAANLNHLDHVLERRFRKNLELCDDEHLLDTVSIWSSRVENNNRRSESTQTLRDVAWPISYKEFTARVATLGVREQASVLIWLGYFEDYLDIKSAFKGLGMSAEAYKSGLALAARKLGNGVSEVKKELSETHVTMSNLADKIAVRGLVSIDGRLVRLGSLLEQAIFYLQEARAYTNNLSCIELEVTHLLDKSLRAGDLISLHEIARTLGYHGKSVQRIVGRIAKKFAIQNNGFDNNFDFGMR